MADIQIIRLRNVLPCIRKCTTLLYRKSKTRSDRKLKSASPGMHKRVFRLNGAIARRFGIFRVMQNPYVNIHSGRKGCIFAYISTPSTHLSTFRGTDHWLFRSYPQLFRLCICSIGGLNTQCIFHKSFQNKRNNTYLDFIITVK